VEDALAGGMTLAEAAPRFGLVLANVTINASGRNAANEAVPLPVPAANGEAVLRAIFTQSQGAAPRLAEFGDAFIVESDVAQITGMTFGFIGTAMFVFARIEVTAGAHCLRVAAIPLVMDVDAFGALGVTADFTAHAHDVCAGLSESHSAADLTAAARLQRRCADGVQLWRAGAAGGEDDKGCSDGNVLHGVISFGAP
jgi:hypothetical protein